MVEKSRDLYRRRDAVADLERLAEQNVGAETLEIRLRGREMAVVEARPPEDAEGDAVIRLQDVAAELPTPGGAEIILVGVAPAVEFAAEGRARLHHPAEISRNGGRPGIAEGRLKD